MNAWLTRPCAIRCASYDEHPVLLVTFDRDWPVLPTIGEEVFLWTDRDGGGLFGHGTIVDEPYCGGGGHDGGGVRHAEELRLEVDLKSWDVPLSIDDAFGLGSDVAEWARSRKSVLQLAQKDASVLRNLLSSDTYSYDLQEHAASIGDRQTSTGGKAIELDAELSQGFIRDAEVRRAIENRAMELAKRHFTERGFNVVDTSANKPYDLECAKSGDVVRVEVKGSIAKSSRVHLTRNEVLNARSHPTVLFIVGCIEVDVQSSPPQATGGSIVKLIENWHPDDNDLMPETYTYCVPLE